ncbi:hypothetical protein [Spirosoma arcticum]
MNTLLQKTITGLGLALSLSFASCEKDNLLDPTPAGSARSGAVNDDILPGSSQVHKLTKYGAATLTYADNGQLLNVTTPVSGSLAIQTDYTYSPGKIKAFTHQGNTVLRDETFTLDASGRCTESAQAYTVINNNTPMQYATQWVYKYTAKGQLWSCYNKNSCVGGTNYTYNADGDMILATVATSAFDFTDITFAYSQRTVAGLLNDEYPVNLNVPKIPEHDAYLRIFGKPSKHLVQRVSYEPSGSVAFPAPSDRFYTYVLNADGYVKQRSMFHTLGGSSVENTAYEYLVGNPTM